MRFQFNDGGRRAAGFKGSTSDCVCRAIAIVSGLPYREDVDHLHSRLRRARAAIAKARGEGGAA